MCGILACVALGRTPVATERLQPALEAMRHRGPDGTGCWVAPTRRAALGHVRLAMLAPHGGAQPITSADGLLALAANGEIYHHLAQRTALEARGHRFNSQSDSEIALHLYKEHGLDLGAQLEGEVAFVLWDEPRQRLIAWRDRFGIRPLCWARIGDQLCVASEAKALFALGHPARWNPAAVHQALTTQYVLPEQTLFAGVQQVPPGHLLVVEQGVARVVRWWAIDFPAIEPRPASTPVPRHPASLASRQDASAPAPPGARGASLPPSLPEAASTLRHHLERAVAARLQAEVPLCCHLSGGLDASSVLALSAHLTGRALPAFTVSFAVPSHLAAYDEAPQAQRTATALGADLEVVRLEPCDLLGALPVAVERSEGWAINAHLPAKHLLSHAMRAAGFRGALTGEGADEVLGGYPHFLLDHLEQGETAQAPETQATMAALRAAHGVSTGIMLAHGDTLDLSAFTQRLGYAPAFMQAKASLGHKLRPLLDPAWLQQHAAREPFAAWLDALDPEMAGRHPLHQSTALWMRSALAQYILRTLGDGAEMAHGVEGRLPFLDGAVVECLRTLPPRLVMGDPLQKGVLRLAMHDLLPSAVLQRPKHPFMAPPLTVMALPQLEAALHDHGVAKLGFVSAPAVWKLIRQLHALPSAARAPYDPVLMTLLSAACMQRRLGLS